MSIPEILYWVKGGDARGFCFFGHNSNVFIAQKIGRQMGGC
jgi:hypothetical protein